MADINFSKIRYKAGTISTEKETMIIRIQGNKLGTITHSTNAVDKCCKPSDIEPGKPHKICISAGISRCQCNIGCK